VRQNDVQQSKEMRCSNEQVDVAKNFSKRLCGKHDVGAEQSKSLRVQ
jgi:hypothetical protein